MGTRNRNAIQSSSLFTQAVPSHIFEEYELKDYVDFDAMFNTKWFKQLEKNYPDGMRDFLKETVFILAPFGDKFLEDDDIIQLEEDKTVQAMREDDFETLTATILHELVHRSDQKFHPGILGKGRTQPLVDNIPPETDDGFTFTFQGCGDYYYSRTEVNAHQAELSYYLSMYSREAARQKMFSKRHKSLGEPEKAPVFNTYLDFLEKRIKNNEWEQEPEIKQVIDSVKGTVVGTGGNCGVYAIALNNVLGGKGRYVGVVSADGQVLHVLLRYKGKLYDSAGERSKKELYRIWGDRKAKWDDSKDMEKAFKVNLVPFTETEARRHTRPYTPIETIEKAMRGV